MHYAIIGTDHELQKAASSDKGLEEKIAATISRGGVVLIAEEVDANIEVDTFGRELSKKLIAEDRWLSVDTTHAQRKDAGIYDDLDERRVPDFSQGLPPLPVCRYFLRADGIRENFWLDRIEKRCAELKITEGTVVITWWLYTQALFMREGKGTRSCRHPGRVFAT